MAKRRVGVLLFDEVVPLLEAPLQFYIRRNSYGHYFACESIDSSGPLLTMILEPVEEERGFSAEVQIPYSWVRLTIKSAAKDPLGFSET